ncbi:unnamed protein product [Pleuronectes platessa]|uniref:Uncharacterized protein n=1 Tax=Pleuronectes platessa TaxID=8262 RepID=A0A9N7Z2R7_PLEPL|nr:unnamed protein product [Pleuronectes platessa]
MHSLESGSPTEASRSDIMTKEDVPGWERRRRTCVPLQLNHVTFGPLVGSCKPISCTVERDRRPERAAGVWRLIRLMLRWTGEFTAGDGAMESGGVMSRVVRGG